MNMNIIPAKLTGHRAWSKPRARIYKPWGAGPARFDDLTEISRPAARLRSELAQARCHYAGAPSDAARRLSEILGAFDAKLCTYSRLQSALQAVSTSRDPDHILFVNLDDFGGIEQVIDDLIPFRARWPGVKVILISSGFGADSGSSHRMYIADFSLKAPISEMRVHDAIHAALANNRLWIRRSIRQCPGFV